MKPTDMDTRAHAFLNREPGLLAVIGTNTPRGFPMLVPVWYRWDGASILVWSIDSRAWVKNVARDPKVGVSVQEEAAPQMAVMMRGQAVVETSDAAHIDDEMVRIAQRYMAPEKIDAYLDDWRELRSIVRIVPERIFVWG